MATTTYYTPAQLAEQWNCSADQVRALIDAGELEATNISCGSRRARWIIAQESADEFRARRSNRKTTRKPRRRQRAPQPSREWV